MVSSSDIRNLRHEFRASKQHRHVATVSLIADKTSTAMFTVAGMQPLIPYLTGQKHPLGQRLHNIQHCVRTNDIEQVGDNSHHTMFFMMGNWSLGDYFKKDAVRRSWEFLTDHLHLDPKKIAVTVYEGDDTVKADQETADYWKEQGLSSDKISFLWADDNRRSPGSVGPCGPCTEMYYWVGETEYPGINDNVKNDDSKWLEIRNNVFMEFYRDERGVISKLEKQNVDTGMGLERITKVLQNKLSPYETDLFVPVIEKLEYATKKKYCHFDSISTPTTQQLKEASSMRIIADHMRCAVFLMAEWLMPSNEGRWYVLRRIVRRMYFHLSELLDEHHQFTDSISICTDLINSIIAQYQQRYPSLNWKNTIVLHTLEQELAQFAKTIKQWQKILHKMIDELDWTTMLGGKDIFMLYDTFWFPLELTEELCHNKWLTLDLTGFEKELELAKARSRANTLQWHKGTDRSVYVTGVEPTVFVWYDSLHIEDPKVLKTIEFEDHDVIIFDQTPCYATMGGQINDTWIRTDDHNNQREIFDVQNYNGVFLHFVKKQR